MPNTHTFTGDPNLALGVQNLPPSVLQPLHELHNLDIVLQKGSITRNDTAQGGELKRSPSIAFLRKTDPLNPPDIIDIFGWYPPVDYCLRPILGVSSDYRRLFAEKRPPADFSETLLTTRVGGSDFWGSLFFVSLALEKWQKPASEALNEAEAGKRAKPCARGTDFIAEYLSAAPCIQFNVMRMVSGCAVIC